jgi:hypothetical protein
VFLASRIDSAPYSYGELLDSEFNSLSVRTEAFPGHPFRPQDYPGLLERLVAVDRGYYAVSFDPKVVPAHEIHLYWRWVPYNGDPSGRLLLIVGCTKYTAVTEAPQTLLTILTVLFSALAISILWKILGLRLMPVDRSIHVLEVK